MSIISTRIFRRRRRALLKIKPYVEYWHNYLSKSKEQISINYLSGIQKICPEEEEEEVISRKIAEQLLNQRSMEALTGKCNGDVGKIIISGRSTFYCATCQK